MRTLWASLNDLDKIKQGLQGEGEVLFVNSRVPLQAIDGEDAVVTFKDCLEYDPSITGIVIGNAPHLFSRVLLAKRFNIANYGKVRKGDDVAVRIELASLRRWLEDLDE